MRYPILSKKDNKAISDIFLSFKSVFSENIQMNRPINNDIDDVLNRLDELYLLVNFT